MTSLRIAFRYLFAPKSHRAVNVISIIAVVGVAVATMAIMVVLSVFNGFTALSARHLSRIDPDLMVVPRQGKVFAGADSLTAALEALPAVAAAMPSLEERALLVAGNAQKPVMVKGVETARFNSIVPFDGLMLDGALIPDSAAICLAVGPAVELGVRPSAEYPVELYTPRRRGRINPANPAAAYRSAAVLVSGIFAVDQPEYDADYVVADIALLRRLLDHGPGQAGAIEIRTAPGIAPEEAAEQVRAVAGEGFDVLTRELQQPDTYRMIAVEKWVTFLMLVFILVVACFNIVTTLSLMVIEKRADMATLRALGASRATIGSIFAWEGTLITVAGGIAGIIAGVGLAWLQQSFGLVKLGADPAALTIDVYPVEVHGADVAVVTVTVLLIALLLGQIARLFTRRL